MSVPLSTTAEGQCDNSLSHDTAPLTTGYLRVLLRDRGVSTKTKDLLALGISNYFVRFYHIEFKLLRLSETITRLPSESVERSVHVTTGHFRGTKVRLTEGVRPTESWERSLVEGHDQSY